ncbi:DEAD/DEAH box helicase [Rhodococcus sp. H29-C3]|uniref:DEAD/DEAH box helicase n=1 Tax=Rhodococcus sp. H29-C3 TaxID=3046307 RepID=UPI0024B89C70|nr:DEAD/DEAH box helicase [Rhodococcus sp. H29-C3]MDJ0363184.1 DEAD/DEAH box helicase [Rhodococcus sp. H29-C3]
MTITSSEGLQATYLPERHSFALWILDHDVAALHAAARDLDGWTDLDIDLVVPPAQGCEPRAEVRTIRCLVTGTTRLVDGTHVARVMGVAAAQSFLSWSRIVAFLEDSPNAAIPAHLVRNLPIAAHAVPNRRGTAVMTRDAAVDSLRANHAVEAHVRSAGLPFTPRPYQSHGTAWLTALAGTYRGGVLADEMGLGKTAQAIAYMSFRAEDKRGPHLIACPTSLITNWRRELRRFAPHLAIHTYRGPARQLTNQPESDSVVIIGYPTLRTDSAAINQINWDTVFFDEAHMLKNPQTRVARAARTVNAKVRFAMTGTPVENRLDELWALMDLTVPGLLGDQQRFARRFTVPIEQRHSQTALEHLHDVIDPVLLRRKKSQVAGDLPPKLQSDVLCQITSEQERLYNRAVRDAFDGGLGAGASRNGQVLALLTTLKKICNHPALVTGDDGPLGGRSGKLDRLTELVSELLDSGERALIFTQYRQTGDLLVRHLATEFALAVDFYHGGLDNTARDRIIEEFQHEGEGKTPGAPILILSLRAAGYGLNLTQASHVIHFDRWWNPAVEAQATDRAHRIGQARTVTVTALTTEGTVEEHIAAMHHRKKAIADLADKNAAGGLAALSDADLYQTVSLTDGASR